MSEKGKMVENSNIENPELVENPIPIPKIPIKLKADTPSKVSAKELKQELYDIGLTCKHTEEQKLKEYIDDTLKTFPKGKIQGYAVLTHNPILATSVQELEALKFSDFITDLSDSIHSNWQPVDSCPYMTKLCTVGYPSNFDKLMSSYIGFSGVTSYQEYSDDKGTVTAIKEQFRKIAINMSSTLVEDLDIAEMEAALTKIIAPVDPGNNDYDSGLRNRNILLVKGLSGDQCEAIGIMNVQYQLIVCNYKEKKDTHQRYDLTIRIRTCLYTSVEELNNQVLFLQSHLKALMFSDNLIPYGTEVEIFDKLPPAIEDTFIKSLPLTQTENDYISVMVLYSPDLENVGCIDNTDSDCTSSYSKTLTSGFSFTASQKISTEISYTAGTELAKGGFKFGLEISFTEQWNNSQSETVSYSVPGGSIAHLYQGYLRCALLEYDLKNFKYSYKTKGTFLTNILKATKEPIGNLPVQMIKKERDKKGKPLWQTI